jgi:hypothetical protein
MLSPYGVASGGGDSGVWVAPRAIKQKEKCTPCEDFKPTCYELGGSLRLLEYGLSGAFSALNAIPGVQNAEVKLNITGKRCTCCDEDGEGSQFELAGELEGSVKVEIPLTGVPPKQLNFDRGGLNFHGSLGFGCKLVLTPKLKGYIKAQSTCHNKDFSYCYGLSAEQPIEATCEVGPEFRVSENGRDLGRAVTKAFVTLKSGVTASFEYCHGPNGDKSIAKFCIMPVVAEGGLNIEFGNIAFAEKIGYTLINENCLVDSSLPTGASLAGDLAVQIDEAIRQAIEQALIDQGLIPSVPRPGAGLASTLPPATPRANAALAGGDAVCARVKLRIEQDLVLARNAFDAALEIINRDPATPIEDIRVDVHIADAFGTDAGDRFGRRNPALTGLSNVDGTGVIAANATGRASFILVPTSEAAPDGPTPYYVSGLLSYRLGQTRLTVPLSAVPITVYPDPRLQVQYFHQRDVFSDDPFTRDIIEPTVPFSLAVLIHNSGKGEARNVRIISGQPRIVENKKGLLIDFQIIATEVDGVGLSPSLTADFGLIPPGKIALGRWLLTSTLQGLFLDYSATWEHLDSLGKTNLSLIDDLSIHEMIRLVQAAGPAEDGRPDFLVNDVADPEDLPDHIYLSNGTTNDVRVVRAAAVDAPPTASDLAVTLTAAMPSGWAYLQVPDPANGQLQLVRVLRADGQAVPLNTNVWVTDRTFVGNGDRPIRENILHLLDLDSPGSYTLVYGPLPPTDFTTPASAVAPLPAYSAAEIPIQWSGTDAGGSGLARFDVYVAENRGPFQLWLANTTARSAVFPGKPGSRYEFYTIATDAAGNREPAPLTADAETVVALANHAPVLVLPDAITVDEGATASFTASATDAEAPTQSLLFSLAAAPAGATIHPFTGQVTWPTGEASGPGTNRFNIVVRDNGLPPLAATGSVIVVVREVNSPPALEPGLTVRVNEGVLLRITNAVSDPDLPANTFAWRLGPGAPANAAIDNAGVFSWRPTALQGPSTNAIDVIATDSGQPPRSASRLLTVIVRDTVPDIALGLGATNLLAGQSASVPLTVAGTLGLSEVRFLLESQLDVLANLTLANLAPEVLSAALIPVSTNTAEIQIRLDDDTPDPFRVLARLGFTADATHSSARLTLHLRTPVVLDQAGNTIANIATTDGTVIVVNQEPVLAVAPALTRSLLLYGRPGKTYTLERTTTLPVNWTPIGPVTLAPNATSVTVPLTGEPGTAYYRARLQ